MQRAIFFIVTSFLICSCVGDPHENFKNHLKYNIGKKADDPSSDVAHYSKLLAGTQVLPNGNTENKYQWKSSCVYYFEIEKDTKVIVGWRFEGSKKDCAIAF